MALKVVIDTDPGVDDAMAIALAQLHPGIEILGLTTVFGNAGIADVTRNALRLKALLGIDAPVAQGAAAALLYPAGPPPAHVHGADGMGDADEVPAALPALDARPAHRLIVDLARAHPGELTLVCIGRLTNLALALLHEPDLPRHVRSVVIMGGAFGLAQGAGNVTPVAEANIIGDPHAAARVFAAPWPVTAVGLDVTRQVRLTPKDFARLEEKGGPAGRFIAAVTPVYTGYHRRFGIDGCYVHDPSAVACALIPELFTLRSGPVAVAVDGPAVGQTIQRPAAAPFPPLDWDHLPPQQVAVDVDAEGVRALFLDTLLAAG
jgi:inosine-uridine nucleoside N-ribohydrolase